MGSVRGAITSALRRCGRGSCYGIGFVTSAVFLIVMIWLLWCYFGLVSFQTADSQRRAIVHYSITNSSKPNLTTTSTPTSPPLRPRESWNSTGQATQNRSPVAGTSRVDNTAKGDFDSREGSRRDNNTANRSKGTVSTSNVSANSEARLAVILREDVEKPSRGRYDNSRNDDETQTLTVRVVSSSAPENNPSIASKESIGRVDEIPPASRPKTDYDDKRVLDPTPVREGGTSRSRIPVDRDPYVDDRPVRRPDNYDRGRVPVREYRDEELEREKRPVDSVGRRRDSYDRDDDLPRRRYDSIDDRDYDRVRKGDSGERTRIPDSRRGPEYDRPRSQDDRYRYRYDDDDDRRRDDRYRPSDDRYRYADSDVDRDRDRYRSRPADDRYRPSIDDKSISERRVDDRYRDDVDDRYRSRVSDDRYRRREDDDRRYRDRYPDDDDRYRARVEPVARDEAIRPPVRDPPRRIVEPIDERRPVSSERDILDDRVIPSSRRRDDYDADGRLASRPVDRDGTAVVRAKADRDERYTERIDDYRSVDRDPPSRSRYDRVDDLGVRRSSVAIDDEKIDRRIDSDVLDKGYRRRDYDDPEIRETRLNKGDERILDRDRPPYIAEDRVLSRGLSPEATSLDRRSYLDSDTDYVRSRPRPDPKLATDEVSDRYRPSSRRSDDPDTRYRPVDDTYTSRSKSRVDDDYRDKGDYGRDRVVPYDESGGRSYPRKESSYDDRDSLGSRSGDRRLPPRVVDDDRPSSREVPRYDSDSRAPPRRRPEDDEYRRRYPDDEYSDASGSRSSVRDTVRPVVREKRFQDSTRPCAVRDRSSASYGDSGDCETEAVRASSSSSRKPPGEMRNERSPNPLSPKDVIEAAYKHKDVTERPREVIYPVYDPRVSNITSSEVIRPSERRGTVINSRKKRK